MSFIRKIECFLSKLISFFLIVSMALLVLGTFWQVFTRFVLNDPSTFTEELLRFLLIWSSMLGTVFVFLENGHIALTILKDSWPDKLRLSVETLIDLFVIIFAYFVMLRGGYTLVVQNLTQITPILHIKVGVVYSIIPISGMLTIFVICIHLIERGYTIKMIKNSQKKM